MPEHQHEPMPEHQHKPMPEHLQPMLATPGQLPAQDEQWAYEVKWDGVRAISYWQPGAMRIESRNLNDISARYPELRPLGEQLGEHRVVLDGEIVALDEHGRPSFELLAHRMHLSSVSAVERGARQTPVTYIVFDLLHLDGQDTMSLPYRERRALLTRLGCEGPHWRTPEPQLGGGHDFLAVTAEHGLEGVLAKRLQSPYRPGQRSRDWLKIKHRARQELVIGGWLPGQGRRSGALGALLMGYHETEADDKLRYAGRVGTGFDEHDLQELGQLLAARARRTSPFASRGTQPPRGANFVKPDLVAEIEFSHWTREHILRHSVYLGLRDDKPAREVTIELPGQQTEADVANVPAATHRKPPGTPRRPSQPYTVLHRGRRDTEVEVAGQRMRLSNLEKVFYPQTGLTKGDMIDYYAAVAPVLLPHLAGRPLTLKRYPDGVQGQFFYEKRCPAHRPDWVHTAAVPSDRQREPIEYCVAEDLPTLLWAANLADIELHTSLARASDIDTPTAVVFDLDPGEPAGLRECCRVASWIADLLHELGLQSCAKTSGAKGLQVYLPLNTPVSYAQTKPFARAVAELLQKRHSELVVSRMTRSLRPERVLIDWSQNDPHKTTVCVYSLRARERPTISTPLTWEEVRRGARRRSQPQLSEEPAALLARVRRHGDLFAPLLDITQELPELGAGAPRRHPRARPA
ncbi:MAG TPA: DNA ligase D [Solirubrobacteraceae bacterium]|nr:DNA ligase D [Solirubrobacteraceae bacterium]